MKECRRCLVTFPGQNFSPNRANSDGLQPYCKPCNNALAKARRERNPEAHAAARKKYRSKPEAQAKERAYDRERARANRERLREARNRAGREWSSRNLAKRLVACRERQLRMRLPAWADRFVIEEIYDLARRRTLATGFKWHVDHVVPLKGATVCGLHVHNNLNVIPAKVNRDKFNKLLGDV